MRRRELLLACILILGTTAFSKPASADFIPKSYHEAKRDLESATEGRCRDLNMAALEDLQNRQFGDDDALHSAMTLGLTLGAGIGTSLKGGEVSLNSAGYISPGRAGVQFAWNARLGALIDSETRGRSFWGTGYGAVVFGSHSIGTHLRYVEVGREETWGGEWVAGCDVITSARDFSGVGLSAHYDTIISSPGFGIGLFESSSDYQVTNETYLESMMLIVYPPFPDWGGGVHFNLNYPGPDDGTSFQWGYFLSISVRGDSATNKTVGYLMAGLDLGLGMLNLW